MDCLPDFIEVNRYYDKPKHTKLLSHRHFVNKNHIIRFYLKNNDDDDNDNVIIVIHGHSGVDKFIVVESYTDMFKKAVIKTSPITI